MDVLNVAVFLVALAGAAIQHILSAGPSEQEPVPKRRWWANGMLFVASSSTVTLFAAAIAWLTGSDSTDASPLFSIGGVHAAGQVLILLGAHSFLLYWLHRAMHHIPLFWAFHRIHHADTALDATTGLRNHPVDASLSYLVTLTLTVGLSPSAEGMLGYFLLAIGFALFTHMGSAMVPPGLDRTLSGVFMTPRQHAVHHSSWRPETDSNFGDILVVWDRLFGTWRAGRLDTQPGKSVGLEEFAESQAQDPFLQLASPFQRAGVPPAATADDPNTP